MSATTYAQLHPGDWAPWFHQRSTSNDSYAFDTVGGRYVLLCFFGSATETASRERLRCLLENRARFDDARLAFFGISIDRRDEESGELLQMLPGIRYFWDFDRRVSRLYGALPEREPPPGGSTISGRCGFCSIRTCRFGA